MINKRLSSLTLAPGWVEFLSSYLMIYMGDMMRVFIVLFVLFLSCAGYSEATFVTADHLLSVCKSFTSGDDYNNVDERICAGYVMGVHDTAKSYESLFGASPLYCEPPRVTSDQMVFVVKRYLQSNPELLQSPASPKVIDALAEEFPCD